MVIFLYFLNVKFHSNNIGIEPQHDHVISKYIKTCLKRPLEKKTKMGF